MAMQFGNIPGINKPISRLVQGTLMLQAADGTPGFDLLDSIFELGCNTFDTGRSYLGGRNEVLVGQWVRERGIRDQLVIIGKIVHPSKEDPRRVTPDNITSDLMKSLEAFQFDYIDLLLLHRDDESKPVGPIMDILNEHLEAGRIHAFGGSNWSHRRLQEANDYAESHGLQPFVASSPNFSLADRMKEPWPGCLTISGPVNADARQWYSEHQMPIFSWSSLAGGFFSGRFKPDNLDTFDNVYDKVAIQAYCYPENFNRLERAQKLADESGLTLPQVAMAYVMSYPMDVYAITGCYTPDEFRVNMEASDMRLDEKTLAWLDLRSDSR